MRLQKPQNPGYCRFLRKSVALRREILQQNVEAISDYGKTSIFGGLVRHTSVPWSDDRISAGARRPQRPTTEIPVGVFRLLRRHDGSQRLCLRRERGFRKPGRKQQLNRPNKRTARRHRRGTKSPFRQASSHRNRRLFLQSKIWKTRQLRTHRLGRPANRRSPPTRQMVSLRRHHRRRRRSEERDRLPRHHRRLHPRQRHHLL